MSRAELVANLRDPKVQASRLAEAAFSGVGTALVAPARLRPAVCRALHGSTALLAGGATAYSVAQIQDAMSEHPRGWRGAAVPAGVSVGLLLLGASVVGVKADAATENWLKRHDVRHPRVWMGVVVGAVSLAAAWLGDLTPDADELPEGDERAPEADASEDVAGPELD